APRGLPLAAVLLLGLLGACDDDDETPPLAVETIGPAGGAVGSPDGAALTVPAGALAGEVAFRIYPGQISIVPGYVDVGPAHVFTPESTVFLVPAQIEVPYAPD